MALSLVSPLISFVAKKAGSSLIDQFCQMHGMKKNHEKLKRQLLAVEAVIRDAEERGATEPHVQAWLEELNAAAYKAEDLLDEFRYEALRQKALSQEPSSSMNKVIKTINLHENPIVFRYKMSKKLVKVLEKINEIIYEMNTFGFKAQGPQLTISRPETCSYVIESEVIGRDGEKEKIMNILLDTNREMEKVSILPIVGMGGAGKTTLAQLVYNETKVQDHFKLKMWVCVSNNFNVVKILNSMIEQLPDGQCVSTSNLEALQKRLCEALTGNKYLLVLDDVWNEDILKWDDLKTLLMCEVCSGSIIIVTTRSKKVASMMGTLPIHDLAMLSEVDSWNLFRKRAFREAKETEQFVEIGRKIVDKCGGLPLALKAIGGLMGTKRDVCEWRSLSENKIWYGDASNNGILPALKLSYDQLPGYMKQCFTFCAMFPEDYVFEKERLIQLWMANGFIQNDEIKDLHDRGECIFNELCLRSFFQEIKEENFYGNIEIQCKMHDLMYDLAKHIAGKQCASSMLEVEKDHVQHLLITDYRGPENLSVLREFAIIRTCLFDTRIQNISDNVNPSSMKSISLRALKINYTGGEQLPKELGYMKHLKYLDLTDSSIRSLPETLTSLYNLQTLNLTGTNVSILPEGMKYLISLENLIFDRCDNIKKMPINIGTLKNLRVLTKYIVDRDPGRSVEELKNLNLHGKLILSGLENVRNRNEAKAANMVSKTKLYSLELYWDSSDSENTAARNDDEVLEGLQPFDLKHLSMYYYAGFEFAVWMKDTSVIRNLRTLKIHCCNNCTKLPPLWKLPFLTNLSLTQMRNLVCLCNTESTEVVDRERLTIFPNLNKLELRDLNNLKGWHEHDHRLVEFPQLEELRINECPKLQSIPFTPSLIDFHIHNPVKLLQISNMTMGTPSKLNICLSLSPSELDSFRPPKNVVKMEVIGLENVIPLEEDNEENCQNMALRCLRIENSNCFFSCGTSKLSLGFWKYFASLQRLVIHSCSALSLWPAEEFRSLKCLKELCIVACKNLTYSSQESFQTETSEEECLPGLEGLQISYCPKLVEIPNCSKSLNFLGLWRCPSVTKDGINWLKNLYELKNLLLSHLEDLKSLPDGLEHLTSLQHLKINNCRAMESFPEGLQQRIPALQTLEIEDCPILVRRCENGGDYQHLITAIPKKYISIDYHRMDY